MPPPRSNGCSATAKISLCWMSARKRRSSAAIAVPVAELAYRVHDLVRSPETLVVVNCAGRTRSIINAGIGNPVAAR